MFSPGKYKQKDGLPRASNIFFPPTRVACARLRSFPWQQAFQTARRERWRAETEARGKGGGVRCRVLYLRAGFLRRHDVRFHLGSVRRRANSAHEPTHRRLCIKCPTLCAATYFFTAFSPYTSLSVILLVVLCRRHFWFGLRSFILRSFVLFSPTISRGPVSFFFFLFLRPPLRLAVETVCTGENQPLSKKNAPVFAFTIRERVSRSMLAHFPRVAWPSLCALLTTLRRSLSLLPRSSLHFFRVRATVSSSLPALEGSFEERVGWADRFGTGCATRRSRGRETRGGKRDLF